MAKIIDKINKANGNGEVAYSFEFFPPKTKLGVENLYVICCICFPVKNNDGNRSWGRLLLCGVLVMFMGLIALSGIAAVNVDTIVVLSRANAREGRVAVFFGSNIHVARECSTQAYF